jgi:hypothetical protein
MMESKLAEVLISEIKKADIALLIVLKSNPRATIYKKEVYWFNTKEDYDSEFGTDEQEFNSRFCEEEKEAYAYAFDAIKKAQETYPNVRIKIVDLGNEY